MDDELNDKIKQFYEWFFCNIDLDESTPSYIKELLENLESEISSELYGFINSLEDFDVEDFFNRHENSLYIGFNNYMDINENDTRELTSCKTDNECYYVLFYYLLYDMCYDDIDNFRKCIYYNYIKTISERLNPNNLNNLTNIINNSNQQIDYSEEEAEETDYESDD